MSYSYWIQSPGLMSLINFKLQLLLPVYVNW